MSLTHTEVWEPLLLNVLCFSFGQKIANKNYLSKFSALAGVAQWIEHQLAN